MGAFVVVIVAVLIIVILAVKILQKPEDQKDDYPYKKIGVLFTPAERSFLGVLSQAVADDAIIFGKVRVADVVTPIKGMTRRDWQRAFNRISAKHFDFLLCDKNKLSVLCVIELNDASHSSSKRKKRDKFLSGVCNAANIPLIHVVAKSAYSISEIRQLIVPYLQTDGHASAHVEKKVEKESPISDSKKMCPKCSSVMVRRVAKKGKHVGTEFWACSAFPKCRYVEGVRV